MNKFAKKLNQGFTLLEVVISMGLLTIVITITIAIIRHNMATNNILLARSELFHQASMAMEFISANVDSAYYINFNNTSINIRRRPNYNNTIFFLSTTNRLYFSGAGNEFARYIQSFIASPNDTNTLLYVHIVTKDHISNNPAIVNPIAVSRVFDISGRIS